MNQWIVGKSANRMEIKFYAAGNFFPYGIGWLRAGGHWAFAYTSLYGRQCHM
ncbi:hypothetical protein K250101E9_40120 [Enterocloster aldenensis]|jgi:hypothetical protein